MGKKEMVKIISRKDVALEYIRILELEQDYLLGSLYEAVENDDTSQKTRLNKDLKENVKELKKTRNLLKQIG